MKSRAIRGMASGQVKLCKNADSFNRPLFFLTIAFFVALLPEKVKRRPGLQAFDSTGMHILSGVLEAALSLVLFFRGLFAYLVTSGAPLNDRYLENTAEIRYDEVFGMGLVGWFSYLLRPLSWLYIYCFVEGVVRSLDAILSERNLGITFSHVLWIVKCEPPRHQGTNNAYSDF